MTLAACGAGSSVTRARISSPAAAHTEVTSRTMRRTHDVHRPLIAWTHRPLEARTSALLTRTPPQPLAAVPRARHRRRLGESDRSLQAAARTRVRYSAAVDQPIPILMATDSTVKHEVPPKAPKGQPATRAAAHRGRPVWVGWRTSGPVHPVTVRRAKPNPKPTKPPKLPREVRSISPGQIGAITSYAEKHGFDVPDMRGWTTKIGTEFHAEMVEMVEQDRWSD
jgi:hypothetical protein